MAGIGFALRKLLVRDEMSSILTGFFLSAVVAAGPWILTSVGLLIIGFIGVSSFSDYDRYLEFRSIVTFLFASTLILTAPLQVPMTRYMADLFYRKNYSRVRSLLITSVVMALGIAFIPGITGLLFLRLPLGESLAVLDLFFILLALWITSSFVSTLKDYNAVGLAFLTGNLISIGGVFFGARMGDVTGGILGYALGQGMILTVLIARLLIEFPGDFFWDADGVAFFRHRLDLALIGIFFSAGVWVDKILYWYGPGSRAVVGFIRMNKEYDVGMFFALLLVIPTLALFVAYFETGFYEQYRFFFLVVHGGYPLSEIGVAKEKMIQFLRRALAFVIKIQGAVTVLVLLNAHHMLSFFHADLLALPVFRIGSIGALMQVLFVLETTLLLYLNRGDIVLKLCGGLFVLNLALTLFFMKMGSQEEGLGYFFSCFLVTLWGYFHLDRAFLDFEYTIFMRQPLSPDGRAES